MRGFCICTVATFLVACVFSADKTFAQLAPTPLGQLQDARSNALAGAGAADGSDPSNILLNPAVAGGLRGLYLTGAVNEVEYSTLFFSGDGIFGGLYLAGGFSLGDRDSARFGFGGEFRWVRQVLAAQPFYAGFGVPVGTFEPWDEYLSFTLSMDLRTDPSTSSATSRRCQICAPSVSPHRIQYRD